MKKQAKRIRGIYLISFFTTVGIITSIMTFKFNPGDTAYIMSRYNGLQEVKIVSQLEFEKGPCPYYRAQQ